MAERNLLLGRGEALTSVSPIARGGGKKKFPYSIQEVRAALGQPLAQIEAALLNLPPAAKPRGEGVFELTLHPAFLGRSYYPHRTLERCGLRDLGSKETTIVPRKVTAVREDGKPQATATLFVAGNVNAVRTFALLLSSDSAPQVMQREFQEIETLSWVTGDSKIVGPLPADEQTHSFEIALHAGADEEDIVAAFADLARRFGAKAEVARRIRVGKLTFLPLHGSASALRTLSEFTFLRVARPCLCYVWPIQTLCARRSPARHRRCPLVLHSIYPIVWLSLTAVLARLT